MRNYCDVVILGGGLAGLTLSLQLKRRNPDLSVVILEQRETKAPNASHKVGESTVELGTYYLREVLGLREYLDEHQLPKHGLRFFFTPQHKNEIHKRVELGPRERLPVPSHQLDRGIFENELIKRTTQEGTKVILSAKVQDVELSEERHSVVYRVGNENKTIESRWVVDATGRSNFLKRKLGFKKEMEHDVNAVWFRIKGKIDIDEWSNDSVWSSSIKPGLRYLSTIHLMDQGYWVWIIPLVSGNTSIGIVADPTYHSFSKINRFEKAMEWLHEHEPQCASILEEKRHDLLDFKVLKHYAHHSGQLYSSERWGVTGEAGAFLDPFYSPGTDFIAMNNTWLTELILKECEGEDILFETNVFERTHLSMVDHWIPIYQDKYRLMGSTQIMVVKIFWDWAAYWALPCVLFTNDGYANIKVLKELFSSPRSAGQKFALLNKKMQDFFLEWLPFDDQVFKEKYIDPFDVPFLQDFQEGIEKQYTEEDLIIKIKENILLLEKIAAQIFRLVSNQVNETALNADVNPYEMTLKKEEYNKVFFGTNLVSEDEKVRKDVDVMWFYNKKEIYS